MGDSFYRIAGLNSEQLRPHVGQRVEVQGRLTDNIPGTEKRRVTMTQDKDGRVKMTIENRDRSRRCIAGDGDQDGERDL